MTAVEARPRAPLAVFAVLVAAASIAVPLVGTVVAVMVVWWASRTPSNERSEHLIRIAALLTAGVAVLHLLAVSFLLPTSVEVEPAQPIPTRLMP